MLQQTQVSRVVDYYHRFIDRFPSLQQLADADAARPDARGGWAMRPRATCSPRPVRHA
jgi:adenine-specific DNA glycosylase